MDISFRGHNYSGAAIINLGALQQGQEFSESLKAELNARFQRGQEALKAEKNHSADLSLADNAPEKAVKKVMVGDQLVATIYKSGVVTIHSPFDAKLMGLHLPAESSSQLGAIRAEIIAKAVGGKIQDVKPASSSSSSSSSPGSRFSVMA